MQEEFFKAGIRAIEVMPISVLIAMLKDVGISLDPHQKDENPAVVSEANPHDQTRKEAHDFRRGRNCGT